MKDTICTKETVKENGLNLWGMPQDGRPPEVDIVAVQGLGAHPFYTWVRKVPATGASTPRTRSRSYHFWRKDGDKSDDEDLKVMWLRDLLPLQVRNARIAAYSHQLDWKGGDIKATLRECSDQFLNILLHKRGRDEERRRPLILIGHSLGGLVIQQALVNAVHGTLYSDIRYSVTGVIFLGAPFRGSGLAMYGEWLAKASRRNARLLATLRKDEPYLHGMSCDFWASYGDRDIVCFYEKKNNANFVLFKQRVVGSQSACINGKRGIYMNTDHSGLNKFSGDHDENYKLLLPEIQRMVNNAPSVLASLQRSLLERIPPDIKRDACQRTAISGVGGMGKTQIALEAAFRVRDSCPDCSIYWVPAVDVGSFENAYREIGRKLEIEGINNVESDIKTLVKEALNGESAGRWLMIVDNIDDIELFDGGAGLSQYLPTNCHGSVLFTTRDSKVAEKLCATCTPIEELNRVESTVLLQASLDAIRPDWYQTKCQDPEAVRRLLDSLGDLPLAVKQSSAFIATARISIHEYLTLYRYCETDLSGRELNEECADLCRYQDGPAFSSHEVIPDPVIQTFLVSFKRIAESDALAADYLIFIEAKAIGTLKGYGFLKEQENGDSYDIHRLVRLSMRYWLARTGDLAGWATKVIHRVEDVFDFTYHRSEGDNEWVRYMPHAQSILVSARWSTDVDTRAKLILKVANNLDSHLGRHEGAVEGLTEALRLEIQDDSILMGIKSDLGNMLCILGRHEKGQALLDEAMTRYLAMDTISMDAVRCARRLSWASGAQGKLVEAERRTRKALELTKKMVDNERPDVGCVGDLAPSDVFAVEAQSLYQRARLAEHNDVAEQVLWIMRDYAENAGAREDDEEAERTLRRALELAESAPDSDHHIVLDVRKSLGWLRAHQPVESKCIEGVNMLRQLLMESQTRLGGFHPKTLEMMRCLGAALGSLGRFDQAGWSLEEAVTTLRQALALTRKVRGEKHPDTLQTVHSLGMALCAQPNLDEAASIFYRTTDLRKKVLAAEHPGTLTTITSSALPSTNRADWMRPSLCSVAHST
ncbi:hypothetical protein F5B22DRAFT_657326 [Xylaria bambusicola]|uniref:uncharacterized protein n=1 Tax=Xylaria bambusicola TaxID=326684 RepID=UPI002008443D|nr:uncharacterized protein F5B22DRAFT_657326 [Xylaria bambusicola]KAI0513154.1 hypothetical protein F5B22DRAFT_657326 [Xylaria bambusicola]